MARAKPSRKVRRSRPSRRYRSRGGALMLSPAGVDDATMTVPSSQNLAQGQDYARIHQGQHGGASVTLASAAPVGDTGVLDSSLRGSAHLLPLDAAVAAASGMRDQAGGGSLKKLKQYLSKTYGRIKNVFTKRGKKYVSRTYGKGKKYLSRTYGKGKKYLSKTYGRIKKVFTKRGKRGQRGGASYMANPADYASPGMLLPAAMENKALMEMNPEWKLAADPTSFAPKM